MFVLLLLLHWAGEECPVPAQCNNNNTNIFFFPYFNTLDACWKMMHVDSMDDAWWFQECCLLIKWMMVLDQMLSTLNGLPFNSLSFLTLSLSVISLSTLFSQLLSLSPSQLSNLSHQASPSIFKHQVLTSVIKHWCFKMLYYTSWCFMMLPDASWPLL